MADFVTFGDRQAMTIHYRPYAGIEVYFLGISYNIFCGNSIKNLHFPRIDIIFIDL